MNMRSRRRGGALVIVVALMAVLLLLGATLLEATRSRSVGALEQATAVEVLAAAEAAVALKVRAIEVDDDLSAWTYVLPGRLAPIRVLVTPAELGPDAIYLRADADFVDSNGVAGRRRVDSVATRTVDRPFGRGFRGRDGVRFVGMASTDSFDSGVGPYAPGGGQSVIASDGPIVIVGAATIQGDVLIGPNGTPPAPPTYTGALQSVGADQFELAPVDTRDAERENANASLSFTGPATYDPSTHELQATGTATVTFLPGTYYFSQVTLAGMSTLVLAPSVSAAAPVIIFVSGDWKGAGGSLVNPSGVPAALQLYSAGASVDIAGGAGFHGLVHAPDAHVRVVGGGDVYGAINARELETTGGAGLHYDVAASDVVAPNGRLAVTSWREAAQ
jgi:hypothetical protein